MTFNFDSLIITGQLEEGSRETGLKDAMRLLGLFIIIACSEILGSGSILDGTGIARASRRRSSSDGLSWSRANRLGQPTSVRDTLNPSARRAARADSNSPNPDVVRRNMPTPASEVPVSADVMALNQLVEVAQLQISMLSDITSRDQNNTDEFQDELREYLNSFVQLSSRLVHSIRQTNISECKKTILIDGLGICSELVTLSLTELHTRDHGPQGTPILIRTEFLEVLTDLEVLFRLIRESETYPSMPLNDDQEYQMIDRYRRSMLSIFIREDQRRYNYLAMYDATHFSQSSFEPMRRFAANIHEYFKLTQIIWTALQELVQVMPVSDEHKSILIRILSNAKHTLAVQSRLLPVNLQWSHRDNIVRALDSFEELVLFLSRNLNQALLVATGTNFDSRDEEEEEEEAEDTGNPAGPAVVAQPQVTVERIPTPIYDHHSDEMDETTVPIPAEIDGPVPPTSSIPTIPVPPASSIPGTAAGPSPASAVAPMDALPESAEPDQDIDRNITFGPGIPWNEARWLNSPDIFLAASSMDEESTRLFLRTEIAHEILSHIRTDGENSPCEHLGYIFPLIHAEDLHLIQPECMVLVEAQYFSTLSEEQFNHLDVQGLLADQASQLPGHLFSGLRLEQAVQLNAQAKLIDPRLSACAGFTSEHLNSITDKRAFQALGTECFYAMQPEEVHDLSSTHISWLPDRYFSEIRSQLPGLDAFFAKVTDERQFGKIPQIVEDESQNPFYGLQMSWGNFGGSSHSNFVPLLSLQSVEVMHPETLQSMGVGEFDLLSPSVQNHISAEAFRHIPADAMSSKTVQKLMLENTKLCSVFTENHLHSLDSDEIPSACARLLPSSTLKHYLLHSSEINEDVLALEEGEHLSGLSWIKDVDILSARHWNRLGSHVTAVNHPCSHVHYEDVRGSSKGVKAFWAGITTSCLCSLPFLEDLRRKEFECIPEETLLNLPGAIWERIPIELRSRMDKEERISPSSIGLAALSKMTAKEKKRVLDRLDELPAFTAASLTAKDANEFANPLVLAHINNESMQSLSPEFIGGLDASQQAGLRPEALLGAQRDHLEALNLSSLPAESFSFIPPVQFQFMTHERLEEIPMEAWRSYISKEQIAAIDPDELAHFKGLGAIGAAMDPLSPRHPCNGVTKEQRRALDPIVSSNFKTQCKPVFASHKLQHRTPA